MTDRPILFSAPMVRALLDGRKTQTRRVLKPQPPRFMHYGKDIMDWGLSGIYQDDDNVGTNRWWLDVQTDVDDNSHGEIKVAAAVGDRLWVRETLACCVDWGLFYDAHGGIGPREEHFLRDDRAEAIVDRYSRDDETIWNVPSIFMPRWASRLTLIVTDVRVERLQDISEADAIAEGIREFRCLGPHRGPEATFWTAHDGETDLGASLSPRLAYASLWDEINGPGAWEANPWVAAHTFTPHLINIDQMEPQHG